MNKTNNMKPIYFFLILLFSFNYSYSQNAAIPTDTAVITHHSTIINNKKIDYSATTGTQPLWDKSGKPIATLYYTYYKKKTSLKKGATLDARPLVFSFNGGPGSASVWMHIAYTGPKVLKVDDEGYPIQPYGIKDNPHSILDVADIVFINPVNTGYSRMIPADGKDVDRDQFFGINADIKYLAEWMNTFVSRNNRWLSPKYLIGESYGGTRVSGLALELQNKQWMYLNGVILVSPADYKAFQSDPAISSAINFPYFTATAWYHNMLPKSLQEKDLLEILPESEEFAIEILMPALAKGSSIDAALKNKIAKSMSYYTGLSEKFIQQNNLDVSTWFFWKELLRDKNGKTLGRLDSRYLGIDKIEAGAYTDHNIELKNWLHSFTPAINYYIRQHLNFKTDIKYNVFGDVHPWDKRKNNTRENLREAMAQNPYLNVLFQSGYYDGATTYFNAKYTMWQIDPSGKMKDRLGFKGYRSGHMMYLRAEDLKMANDDLRNFILNTFKKGKVARY